MGFRVQLDIAACQADNNLRTVPHGSWIFDELIQGANVCDVSL